jgi:IS5 family transposase
MYISKSPIEGAKPVVETKMLADTLSQDHYLIKITKKIGWALLESEIGNLYSQHHGRPALSLRLMIGLLLLKYLTNLSDEQVVMNWQENNYYQAFTGQGVYEDRRPCDASMMSVFRKRIGKEGCELIFAESIRVNGSKALEKEVICDTTVQAKNITYPTDTKLILAAIKYILRIGGFLGIKFLKIFSREIKDLKSHINFGKESISSEKKANCISRLREIANTLLKELTLKLPKIFWKYKINQGLIRTLRKAINQKKDDKNKIYSIHEPQVKCIAKGKAHTKYEFGSKVSLAVGRIKGIILGAVTFRDNPYDGDTIEATLKNISKLSDGFIPDRIVGDRGYRGRDKISGVDVITPYSILKEMPKKLKSAFKSLLRRRTSIEPIIGHLKYDHRMGRNFLKGALGDDINPLLSAAAFNLLKAARVEDYDSLCKPPRSLGTMPQKSKFPGLPLWRLTGRLIKKA